MIFGLKILDCHFDLRAFLRSLLSFRAIFGGTFWRIVSWLIAHRRNARVFVYGRRLNQTLTPDRLLTHHGLTECRYQLTWKSTESNDGLVRLLPVYLLLENIYCTFYDRSGTSKNYTLAHPTIVGSSGLVRKEARDTQRL